ncbi:hypothetical protein FI667_g16118, partial [Globisporangium splendens]
MGGGGGDGGHVSGSLFRVGDNVELWRVLAFLSMLVVCVIALEQLLHALKHKLAKYPKYLEMMNKVFGELMVLGLIGLLIKIVKEVGTVNMYSPTMIAFQTADLTIFVLAMALILQALCVFFLMRGKNVLVDKAELIGSKHLLEYMTAREGHSTPRALAASFLNRLPSFARNMADAGSNGTSKTKMKITSSDLPELCEIRILRHFFLRTYGLPELFPFSKYLRQAQDNKINHMIEVEMSTWIILLAIAWIMASVTMSIKKVFHLEERQALVYAFVVFSWLSVVLHVAVLTYMKWAIEKILSAAGEHFGRMNRLKCLKVVADQEEVALQAETVTGAIATMEAVRDTERKKKLKRRRMYLTKHDTGFQLVSTVYRYISRVLCKRKSASSDSTHSDAKDPEHGVAAAELPKTHVLHLRWFSRKAWHFVVMSLLMLNGFYVALYVQCVLYEVIKETGEFGPVFVLLTPVPCLMNMIFFQSRILRSFVLVSCIFRVDDTALSDVIDHFTETVELRAEFVNSVTSYMESSGATIADLQTEFESRDPHKTGLLDVESVRLVLHKFGFKLSYFRFNSVVKLLFKLQGTLVLYDQVAVLLKFGQENDEIRHLFDDVTHLRSLDTSAYQSATEDSVGNSIALLESSTQPLRPPMLRHASSKTARSLYAFDYADKEVEI